MPDFVLYPHPALSRKAVARPVDAIMRAAGAALLQAAQDVQAYGLAAAHLGLDEPLVVISVAADDKQRDYRILYNPRIAQFTDERSASLEGSVSMPGIEVPITRSAWVVVEYDDAEGIRQDSRLEGFAARIAQHEIDQMDGIFYLERISRVRRDIALRKFRKNRQ